MEDINEIKAGDICAFYGIDCASGTTFTNGTKIAMSSMHVPEPVLSLAISPAKKEMLTSMGKALAKFQKEDPTFRSFQDTVTNETIISGMGELHLEIYVERMRREYGVECIVGAPQVAYKVCHFFSRNLICKSGSSIRFGMKFRVSPTEESLLFLIF